MTTRPSAVPFRVPAHERIDDIARARMTAHRKRIGDLALCGRNPRWAVRPPAPRASPGRLPPECRERSSPAIVRASTEQKSRAAIANSRRILSVQAKRTDVTWCSARERRSERVLRRAPIPGINCTRCQPGPSVHGLRAKAHFGLDVVVAARDRLGPIGVQIGRARQEVRTTRRLARVRWSCTRCRTGRRPALRRSARAW